MKMTRPPTSTKEALTQLRQGCPELSGVLENIGATENGGVGLYTVFGDVLLPLIANVLTGGADQRFDRGYPRALDNGIAFRQELVGRLYGVLEEWAVSPDRDIRDVVYIELLESGYTVHEANIPDLDVDDLIKYAGPRVTAMRITGPR
jgi:hypothetical protein